MRNESQELSAVKYERPSPAPKKLFGFAVKREDGTIFHVLVAADDRESLEDAKTLVRRKLTAEPTNTLIDGGWRADEAILCTECERFFPPL